MKKKTKLIALVSSFCLVLALGIMGVLAVTDLTFNMGGSVTFSAEGLLVEIGDGAIETTSGDAYPMEMTGKMQGFEMNTDKTMESADIVSALATWTELEVILSPEHGDAVLVFEVTNNMDKTIYVDITATFDEEDEDNKNMQFVVSDGSVNAGQTGEFSIKFDIVNTSINANLDAFDIEVFIDDDAIVEPVDKTVAESAGFSFDYVETPVDGNYTASFSSYTGSASDVVIPAKIQDGDNIYLVTSIADEAFSGSLIESVVIPEGITSIGYQSFYACELKYVSLPSTLRTIGDEAFGWNFDLESIVIPEGVISIGKYAFDYCDSLSSVTLPSTLQSVGDYAFSVDSITIPSGAATGNGGKAFGVANIYIDSQAFCDELNSDDSFGFSSSDVYVKEGLTLSDYMKDCVVFVQSDVDGYIKFETASKYSFDDINMTATLIAYNSAGGDVVIPETVQVYNGKVYRVTVIGYKVFAEAPFDSIKLPDGLLSIGSHAFQECYATVIVPESVTSIVNNAFENIQADLLIRSNHISSSLSSEDLIDIWEIYIKTGNDVSDYVTDNYTNVEIIETGEYAGYTKYSIE